MTKHNNHHTYTCPVCGGYGVDVAAGECLACDGSGRAEFSSLTVGEAYRMLFGEKAPRNVHVLFEGGRGMGGFSPSEPVPEGAVALEKTKDAFYGPWGISWESETGAVKLSRPALREVRYFHGPIEEVVVPHYYSEVLGGNGNDVCFYCGADNGPNGEYRMGWDCCVCGGN